MALSTPVEVDELETARWELRCARRAIIELMPDELAASLSSYVECDPVRREEWLPRVVERLLDAAGPAFAASASRGVRSVQCPLCQQGRSDPYPHGFAYPDGLRRHLLGGFGSRRCPVIAAADALASEHWDERYFTRASSPPQGSALEVARSVPPAAARHYQTGPECPGLPLDAHSGAARSDIEIAQAEHRLALLGFAREHDAPSGAVSYTRPFEGHVVYADPRAASAIWFHCFRSSSDAEGLRWQQRFPSFKLRDSSKHDPLGKFESWLESFMRTPTTPPPPVRERSPGTRLDSRPPPPSQR